MQRLSTLRELRRMPLHPGAQAEVLGYHQPHDGGGGRFVCVARDRPVDHPSHPLTYNPDNNGTIVATNAPGIYWIRLFDGAVTPQMFGAKGGAKMTMAGAMAEGSSLLKTGHYFAMVNPKGWAVAVDGAGPNGSVLHSHVEALQGGWLRLAHSAAADVDGAQVMFGPDDTRAIQAAIDWSIYGEHQARKALISLPRGCPTGGECYIPADGYLVTDALWLGYGGGVSTYAGGKLRGPRPGAGGVVIYSAVVDRPAIAVQGARQSSIEGIAITGFNYGHLYSGWRRPNLADPGDASDWISPSLPPSARERYSIHAGIAVDPHSGPRPEVSYPDVEYPAWAGDVAPYHKGQSSDVTITNCIIEGFVAGVAVQPCNYDGNGDYVQVRGGNISRCAYGITVGNTQSRNVELRNSKTNLCHTALSTGIVGRQNGKLGGVIINSSFGDGIQILDCPNAGVAGPLTITGSYCEGMWRLGRWGYGVSPKNSLTIDGGSWACNHQDPDRGIPAELLEAGTPASVTIREAQILNYHAAASLGGYAPTYALDGVRLSPMPPAVPLEPWEMRARTFLAGMMLRPSSLHDCRPARARITPAQMYDPEAAAPIVIGQLDEVELSDGKRCLTAWSAYAAPQNQPHQRAPIPRRWSVMGIDAESWQLDGRTLHMGMPFAQSAWDAILVGPNVGDAIYHSASGSIFFVRERDLSGFTAVLQNNYREAGGEIQYGRPIEPEGDLYIGNSRIYMLSHYTQATATLGSPILTGAGRGDGYPGHLSEIQIGDYIWQDGQSDGAWCHPASSRVVAIEGNTITLSGAPWRAGTRRLAFFVRDPQQ